jgi:hypothetical protein
MLRMKMLTQLKIRVKYKDRKIEWTKYKNRQRISMIY